MTLCISLTCFTNIKADRGDKILELILDKSLSYKAVSEEIYKLTESIDPRESNRLISLCDSLLKLNEKSIIKYYKHLKIVKASAMKRSRFIYEGVNLLVSLPHDTDLYLNNVINYHIARGYLAMSDYNNSLGYFLKTLAFYKNNSGYERERISNLKYISTCYRRINKFEKNYEFIQEAISESKKINDIKLLNSCYSALALYYLDINRLEAADSIYTSLLNDSDLATAGRIGILNNLAELKLQQNDLVLAEKYINECYELVVVSKDTFWIAIVLAGQGAVYYKNAQYKKSLEVCTKAYRLSKKRNSVIWQKNSCQCMLDNNLMMKDYKAAYENHVLLITLRDSIENEKSHREIIHKELQYDFDMKEAESRAAAKAEKERMGIVVAEDKRRTNLILSSIIIGLILVSVFALFIFRSLQKNKTANKIITAQKHLVEVKQKEILDSIQYAKRIQQSLMPTDIYIQRNINKVKK